MPQKSGTVQLAWPSDEGAFYRKFVDTVAANPAFAGVSSASLLQPAYGPALTFYRRSKTMKNGDTIKLNVKLMHWPGRTPGVTDVEIVNANPTTPAQAPIGPPLPVRLTGKAAEWAGVVAGFLEPSSKHGTSKALVDFVVRPAELDLRRYKALDEGKVGPRPAPVPAQKAAAELLNLLTMSQSDADTFAYAARFEVRGNEWVLATLDLVATVKPLPPDETINDEEGEGYAIPDEGAAIIADIQEFRKLWLSTAAGLIAEQDPTRLDNMLMSIAPFALPKLAKIGKLARLRKLSKAAILGKIRAPRAVQIMQGNRVAVAVNPKLLERALELRKTKFGVEFEHFRKINVSVWEVKVNGKTQIFDAGNVPITDLKGIPSKGVTDVGLHSEGFIAEHLRQLEAKGNKVTVMQIYTERPPCAHCAELLRKYSESPVFHSLHSGSGTKAERLMGAYGISQ